MGKISRIRNKAKRAAKHRIYLDSLKKPVWEKSFLLEGGQGRNINGNAFAMLRCIRSQAKYDDYDDWSCALRHMLPKQCLVSNQASC